MAGERVAPTLRGNVRALPRPAWILFGGSFVNRFGTFVLPFLVLYLTRRGYSAAEAGGALSAYGIGAIGASVAGGHLADRLGRRSSIVLSMFGSAVAMLALSQARSLALIVVLTGVAGFVTELHRPASSALLTDLTEPGQRVTAFALYRLAINAGFAAGPVVAGLLAERSFFLVFLGDAVTSAAFGLVSLAALPEGVRVRRSDDPGGGALGAIAADRMFVLFLLASTAAAFVYFQQSSTFALHIQAHGHSKAVYGALISLNGLAIVLLELPLTAVTMRLPPRAMMATGSALVGIGFGLTALATGVPALAATVLVWTLGEMVYMPVASAYVADLAPVHLRGRYLGAWSVSGGVALVIGPSVGTALYSWSAGGLWVVCLVLGLLAAALVLGPRRRTTLSR